MNKIQKTKIYLTALFMLFSLISIAHAQESQSPPPEIQRLYGFEGKWTGNYSVTMEGNTLNSNASYTWSKISDGWGMLIDESIEMPGMQTYLGHNIIGYDMEQKKYHLYTVSNYAQVHDHIGNWKDDKTMYLEYNGTLDGKPFTEKIYMTVTTLDECTLDVTEICGDKVTGTYKGTFKRSK